MDLTISWLVLEVKAKLLRVRATSQETVRHMTDCLVYVHSKQIRLHHRGVIASKHVVRTKMDSHIFTQLYPKENSIFFFHFVHKSVIKFHKNFLSLLSS